MNLGNPNDPIGSATAEEMARLGIVVVPVNHYHFKTYRYTNMEDALAEARRDEQRARQRSDAIAPGTR